MQILLNVLSKSFGFVFLYIYCQELMKLAGRHGSSFTAIPGEGDSLTLCEQLS
jgi:hypothetical protein